MMSIATMSILFSLLALVSAGLAVLVLGRKLARKPMLPFQDRFGLTTAWLVAATSTGGSLYYSEIAGYIPCELCWWQRIAMYPLVIVLLVAAVRGDRAIRPYVIPVAAGGFLIAAYHYAIQTFPSLQGTVCAVDAPCTARWVEVYGFISIPFMAMCGFALIGAIMVAIPKEVRS